MKTHFPRYFGFLASLFILWLNLSIVRKFGFNFGLDLSIFFRAFLFLLLILIALETKKRWSEIWPIVKSLFLKAKTWIHSSLRYYPTVWSKMVHFFPLIFYFFWRVFKKYVFSKSTVLVLGVLGILLDVFVFDFISDFVTLLLAGLWIWTVRLYKFEGRISVGVALMFLAMCPFLLILKKEPIAEKAAIWAYMFLVVGVGQMFIEYLKEERRSAKKAKE